MHMYLIIILLQFYSALSIITKSYLPKFESLPPPLVYYSENDGDSPKKLSCKGWPPNSEITLYSTVRMPDTSSNNPSRSQFIKSAPLHPLDSQDVENGNLILRNIQQVRRLSKLDLHCLVKTNFGAVISRPFRVVEAKIGNFPSGSGVSAGEAQKIIKYFMHGNVAYIDCLPPESFPPAKIEFELNGTLIPLSKRYDYMRRPNSRKVTLLITSFEPKDQGFYRCIASNPVTGEMKTDPLVHQLKIKNPSVKVSAHIKMSISGKELVPGESLNPSDTITVREGSNVTLLCIMEGVPPPEVTVFKLKTVTDNQYRHISDKELGLLTIFKVVPEDEDSYMCSDNSVSDQVHLKVQKRLDISERPQDIKVSSFGVQAKFNCLSSDPNIIPQWYFNGKLRTQNVAADRVSSLNIINVRKEDLGVYQCVARSQDEWVTHVATLSMQNDHLLSQYETGRNSESKGTSKTKSKETRGSRIKKNVKMQSGNTSKSPVYEIRNELPPPLVRIIDDNLAVLLKWQKATGIIKYYRVQFRNRKKEGATWNAIVTLDNEITEPFFYVTSTYIHPQFEYEFKIVAVLISGNSHYSDWSHTVSFNHVYPTHPNIQQFTTVNSTHVRMSWSYVDILTYPITQYDILIRSVIQEGQKVIYTGFSRFTVKDSNATETYLGPLRHGQHYQAVIYGIREGPIRKITQYSSETMFSAPPIVTSIWGLKNNSESNTKLMFIILGSLAGLMMLVIIVLVLMCYCRERKSIVRLNRYKDPAKLIHSDPSKNAHSSFLLASISAAANNHTQQKHVPDGSMERASLLGANADQVYCQQKRQPPSGGSGHDVSEEASIHETSGTQDTGNSIPSHILAQQSMMTPQPPAVTYYKIAPGPASLPTGSLLRQNTNQMHHHQAQYCPPQYAPIPQQMYYTGGNGFVYPQCSYIVPPQPQQMMTGGSGSHATMSNQGGGGQQMKQEFNDMRSQDGGESVYSYFSQTSNAGVPRHDLVHGTVEAGSQTINSNGTGSASHRHHRRKRRKTNHSGIILSENSDNCSPQPVKMIPRMGYPGGDVHMIGREVMYDTPPSGHDPRIMVAPPGMVLVQPGMSHHDQNWAHLNNTLTRRGTPTLFVEPPRIRDYSEYGIPPNQMVPIQPQQLAHLSQQNLHLHNQNLSGYRDAQA